MEWRSALKQFRRKITYSPHTVRCLAYTAFVFLFLYFKTLKVRYHFHPEYRPIHPEGNLYAFWHGRQFLLVPSFGALRVTIMADMSWAGAIQAEILRRFGYTVVRGSSKRQGMQALLDMKKNVARGRKGAFAVDGPSGPLYQSKPGILFLAKKLAVPLIPLSAGADRGWILRNTWCRYLIPKPFARCLVSFGKPIRVTEAFDSVRLDHILLEHMRQTDRSVKKSPSGPG